jgi:hypothetical protein
MKKLIMVFVTIVLIMSCEKRDITCKCDNPSDDLAWLKELKSSFTNCSCRMAIIQATYNKQTVFYTIMNDPLCDGYFPIELRECSGTVIKTYEPPLGEIFSKEVTNRKEIYSCQSTINAGPYTLPDPANKLAD